jgi:beta-lactamase regulating signal transducer with metallopeptidase domain
MNTLNHLGQQWANWALAASWQLALLIVIVALVARALNGAPPSLRHGLWLLVVLKTFLPPTLSMPWSIGRFAGPLTAAMQFSNQASADLPVGSAPIDSASVSSADQAEPAFASGLSLAALVMIVWVLGGAVYSGLVAWHCWRLKRIVDSAAPIDEGPLRVLLEKLSLELGIRQVPELVATPIAASPCLCGAIRPRIVIPAALLDELTAEQWRLVLLHELLHWQRRDLWFGWLQVLSQGLFWFHPLVWWAAGQLRQQRESACDEAVLWREGSAPQSYGEAIVRVLTASRGRSLVAGSLVGIFERGGQLQDRLEEIMTYEPRKRQFGWLSRLALAATALLLLPMGPDSRNAEITAADDVAKSAPQIVKAIPAVGAKDVDPGLAEISVTFDRDMGKGMSWTGSPPQFPPIDESQKARWTDARTCVLPVKLAAGSFYRVGINSTSFQNFRSADDVPAKPTTIYFTTKGATADVQAETQTPMIARLEPENGAADVDPATSELRVSFNMPMGGGMSWVGGGPTFPMLVEGKKASWSADGLTCTLPVKLEGGHEYLLGLNSVSHINFQSKAGVPLTPVVYTFRTRGTDR